MTSAAKVLWRNVSLRSQMVPPSALLPAGERTDVEFFKLITLADLGAVTGTSGAETRLDLPEEQSRLCTRSGCASILQWIHSEVAGEAEPKVASF
ncbi:MAG: hypothetical protein R3F19_09745 [Verrucomicrobiales bacterium]